VLAAILQAEAHLDDLFLARAKRLEHFGRLLAQVQVDDRLGRRSHAPVERVHAAVLQAEAHFNDRLIARAERLERQKELG
jgi:hypothetical protein